MSDVALSARPIVAPSGRRRPLWQQIVSARVLLLMLLPGFLLILIFNYGPIYGSSSPR